MDERGERRLQQLEAQLDTWKNEVQYLVRAASIAQGASRGESYGWLFLLRRKWIVLSERLEAVSTSESPGEELNASVEAAWIDFKSAMKIISSMFEER